MSLKFNVIAIIGYAGTGKTALALDLVKYSPGIYHKVITATTRNIRDKEIDKLDYHFYSKDEFELKIKNKEFIEHAKYNGNFYGTPISSFNTKKINLLVVEPSGIMSLYNHPKINLLNIVNVEREYGLILNSINDEARIRQITSRRVNKEEEKEFEKIPNIIKNQIINFKNNSSDIRFASINFNKIFNMTGVVNLYDYELDSFIKENLNILKKSSSKTKNGTLKFFLDSLLKEGEVLLKDVTNSKEKNDLFFMSRVNSFMDNLETLKTFNKFKNTASNELTKNTLMDIHSRVSLLDSFSKIKHFYNNNEKKFSEDKKLLFSVLKSDIDILKDSNGLIEKKVFRDIEKNIKTLLVYKSLIEITINNPIVLNSSYLVDYAHIQYNKYNKKQFRLTIDSNKSDLLENDIIYKSFLNNGKKQNIEVILSTNNNHFSLFVDNKPLVVFELNENKLKAIDLPENELINKFKNKEIPIKEIPVNKQTETLYKTLINENLLENYNTSLYIKSSSLREKVESILHNKLYENSYSPIK